MNENEGYRAEEELAGKISEESHVTPNGTALLPFVVFVAVYLGAGIFLQMQGVEMPFYQFPAPLASIIGTINSTPLLRAAAIRTF